jgi:hypothetical protein
MGRQDQRIAERILATGTNASIKQSLGNPILRIPRPVQSEFGSVYRLNFVNRRIPNGTYGGVRGRGLAAPSYSIGCGPDCEAERDLFSFFFFFQVHVAKREPRGHNKRAGRNVYIAYQNRRR